MRHTKKQTKKSRTSDRLTRQREAEYQRWRQIRRLLPPAKERAIDADCKTFRAAMTAANKAVAGLPRSYQRAITDALTHVDVAVACAFASYDDVLGRMTCFVEDRCVYSPRRDDIGKSMDQVMFKKRRKRA